MSSSGPPPSILGLLEEMKTKMQSFSPKVNEMIQARKAFFGNIRKLLADLDGLLNKLNIPEINKNKEIITSLQERILGLEARNKSLEGDNERLQGVNKSLQEEIQALNQQIQRLNQQIQILTEKHAIEIKSLKDQHVEAFVKSNAANDERNKELELAMKQLQAAHKTEMDALNVKLNGLQQEKGLLDVKIEELNTANTKLIDERDLIEESIKNLNETMIEELLKIQQILADNLPDAENDGAVQALIVKIAALKKALYNSSQVSAAQMRSDKIKKESFTMPESYNEYNDYEIYKLKYPEITESQWSVGKQNFAKDVGQVNMNIFNSAIRNAEHDAKPQDKEVEYQKLLTIYNRKKEEKKGGGKRKTYKKNKRINKMGRTNKRLIKGGWTYKGSPSLDSKSSVITDSNTRSKSRTSSKTKSSKSKTRSNRYNKKHKTKKVIKRSKR